MVTRIIGAAIISVSLCAATYTQGTSAATQDKNASAGAATSSGKSTSSDKSSGKTMRHRAKKSAHRSHSSGMHEGMSGMSGMHDGMNGQNSAYHSALKRCVQGPEGQRDNCLDQAIARYGHR